MNWPASVEFRNPRYRRFGKRPRQSGRGKSRNLGAGVEVPSSCAAVSRLGRRGRIRSLKIGKNCLQSESQVEIKPPATNQREGWPQRVPAFSFLDITPSFTSCCVMRNTLYFGGDQVVQAQWPAALLRDRKKVWDSGQACGSTSITTGGSGYCPCYRRYGCAGVPAASPQRAGKEPVVDLGQRELETDF